MIPSVVPIKTRYWRITSSELASLVNDAQRHLETYSNRTDSETSPSIETRITWLTRTRKLRDDSPSGTVDAVASTIDVPKEHMEAGVQLRGGRDREIRITVWRGGAEIRLSSTDQDWLRLVEPWAIQSIEKFTPRWAWIGSWKGSLAFVFTLLAVGYGTLFGVQALGAQPLTALLISGICQAIVLALYVTFSSRPRVIVGNLDASRLRAFATQTSLLLIGALLGVLLTRLFDVLFPLG